MRKSRINKDKLITFIFILVGIILVGFLGYKIYIDFFQTKEVDKTIRRLELYGYSLDKKDGEIYKTYFDELTNVLNSEEIDYKKYAEYLGKLYIVDFYTLSNKLSSTDVGSIEFVYPDSVPNFKLKATDTMYKYVEVNFDGKREQKLPTVSEVTTENIEESMYLLGDKELDSYKIKYKWTYVEDLGYESEVEVVIIKDGSKLYVVGSK